MNTFSDVRNQALSAIPDGEGRVRPASVVLLMLLFLAFVLSMTDRMLLSVLLQPVRAALHITDTQISLLQGLAFILLYSFAAIPIGRLADRYRRTWLLAAGVGLWSMATIASDFAGSFMALFAARTSVGIGEATLLPTGYSLLPDAFARRHLGTVSGIFGFGGIIGLGISLLFGASVYCSAHPYTIGRRASIPMGSIFSVRPRRGKLRS